MLSSRRNRGVSGIDDPWNDDGFYRWRKFKAHNPAQKSKRIWRRALRRWEKRMWQKDEL